jgi:hypothetical protein
MMERLSSELQDAKSGLIKVKAAVAAKKSLMALLTNSCSEYFEKTDT